MSKLIVSNQIKCKTCGDIIYSATRHDFKKCKCGNCFVDGGNSYFRAGAKDISTIETQYIYMEEEDVNKCIQAVKDAIEDKKNERGIAYAIFRVLRDCEYNLNNKNNEVKQCIK
jgi:hypothetical protein